MVADAVGAPLEAGRWRNTLQARLIASHALVILVALGLVLVISAAFLRRYERTAAERQLAQLAVPLLAEVNVARFSNVVSELGRARRVEAIDAQAEAMELRILVLDSAGLVLYDTSNQESLRDGTINGYSDDATELIARAQDDDNLHYVYEEPRGRSEFSGQRLLIAAGKTGPLEARNAIVMVTDKRRFPLLALFLPRLFLVTGISLAIAGGFAYLLSQRLARPVHRLTAAADAMASGQLQQHVSSGGPAEIERLVRSFNSMSSQVASTHRSQRELLANVAHELRTPLTSVQGYAKAIRDGVIDSEGDRINALTVIGDESERMSNLIAQLLDLARLESGQTSLSMGLVSVSSLLQRTRERFQPAAEDKHIMLGVQAVGDIAVLGDEGRLVQILSNLVANAIRHTPEGGTVELGAQILSTRNDGSHRVRLTVSDTGEGIVAESLPVIFERFERGESTRELGSGFGLGLTIARELVELHGGSIDVQSILGSGTTFTIDLPATEPPSAE